DDPPDAIAQRRPYRVPPLAVPEDSRELLTTDENGIGAPVPPEEAVVDQPGDRNDREQQVRQERREEHEIPDEVLSPTPARQRRRSAPVSHLFSFEPQPM